MSTRQSIVTWHPWPENGVEGLPENTWIIFLMWKDGPAYQMASRRPDGFRFACGDMVPRRALEVVTHYALASDLETVHEIDGDKCGILPGALIDRARATANTSPIDPKLGIEPDEARVRWLVEQAIELYKGAPQTDALLTDLVGDVAAMEGVARAQVERHRKEHANE